MLDLRADRGHAADEGAGAARPRPLAHPWRRFWLLVVVIVACVLATQAHIRAVGGTYLLRSFFAESVSVPQVGIADIEVSDPTVVEVVSVGPTELEGLVGIAIELRALADGECTVSLRDGLGADPTLNIFEDLRVTDGVIVANGIDFSGYQAVYASTIIVIVVALALFVSLTVELGRRSWYSYEMVVAVGAALYLVGQLVVFVWLGLMGFVDSFYELAYTYGSLANFFVLLSIPVMGIVVVALALSNISLIIHEGLRLVNMLGIAMAVVWAVVMFYWFFGGQNFSGSFEEVRVKVVLDGIGSSAISYGVTLFLATVLCAWRATHHRVRHDKDYLIILGCGLRDDGSPMPLLQGRIDRALAFEREQFEATGRHATFVPSGGKGDDEIWSEAESMRRYLVAAGVEEGRILCEDRSTNTRENMAFSRARIDEVRAAAGLPTEAEDGFAPYGVAFATTNYHVFRGYIYAHATGLAAEGLGAKTRAYFWPNAFLREFAGLLVAERWSILSLYAIIAIAHAVAAYALFV